MNSVLYFGPWDDTSFLDIFPDAKKFILVDSQPKTQWGYNKRFVDDVIREYESRDFVLMNIEETQESSFSFFKTDEYTNPHLFIFKKGDTTIKYYMSTDIMYNMVQELAEDISKTDTLYINGYFPSCRLFEYFKGPKNFVGNTDNCYLYDMGFNRNIIDVLINFPTATYFNKYFAEDNGILVQVKNFTKFRECTTTS
jgi:hypothetical protein